MAEERLEEKKINAFQLAEKAGRRAKAYAKNRKTAVKATDDMLQGMERWIKPEQLQLRKK